jgi:hypothetical protein
MLLCDEYATRNNLPISSVKFVKKGFAFFGENKYLMAIKWIDNSPGPGFYEISEYSLEKKIKTIKAKNVNWEEYDDFIKSWARSVNIITDRKEIFFLAWEYFVRKNEDFLISNYGALRIFPTIDCDNSNRIFDCVGFLEDISKKNINIYNFWNDKLSEVVSLYCYWLASIKNV